MPRLVAVEPCFPPRYYSQSEIGKEFLRVAGGRGDASREKIERFFNSVGVSGRHLVLPVDAYERVGGFAERSAIWLENALELGASATRGVLARAGLSTRDVQLFASSTVTGIAVPSLEARLMNRLDFASSCRRMPLFGLGCVAGAAGIARVTDYLRAYPTHAALLLCVELCSLTLQLTDTSIANVIAAALFGDGAAAVLLVGDEHPLAAGPGPRVVETRSVLFPNSERTMGWDIVDSGFRIVLSGSVPDLARGPFAQALRGFLAERGLRPSELASWIAHPGGPAVIDSIELGLELEKGALDASRRCLNRVGNLSSVSVLVIAEEALRGASPPPGSHGMLFAMGPGFCAELVLLEW